jgi:hypothetical protein
MPVPTKGPAKPLRSHNSTCPHNGQSGIGTLPPRPPETTVGRQNEQPLSSGAVAWEIGAGF